MKKMLKIIGKIFVIILIVIVVIALIITGMYLYADNKPDIGKGYEKSIQTGGELEASYLEHGSHETSKVTAKAESPISKYTIYYPSEMESGNKTYPMILMVNGTGGKATKYEPQFELFASWGFIVIGTQDKGTGTGETTVKTLHYMLDRNNDVDSVFYHKIDTDNIGITGFSQGGAAVFNVITKFDEAKYFKAAAPLSPVCEKTALETTNYPYDSSEVKCPILVMAGTSGDFEINLVSPLEEMNKQYDKITSPKAMARRVGMTHDDMMYSAGGYVIAWFRWQLMGDSKAAGVFIGESPELLSNAIYQDQRIDLVSAGDTD